MERVAYQLRIREGKVDEYDEAHRHVWKELQTELKELGVLEYSIFRRNQQLFLYLQVNNFDDLMNQLADSEINQLWQEKMAPLFEPVPDLQPPEARAMMTEVFFMKSDIAKGAKA